MDRDASLLSDLGRLDIEDEEEEERLLIERERAVVDDDPVVEFDLSGRAHRSQARERDAAVAHEAPPRRRPQAQPARPPVEEELDEEDVLEITEEQYRAARALAERKLAFAKTVVALVVVNVLFGVVSWMQIPPDGKLWFLWPVGVSLAAVLWHYVRVFLFSGQDLRSIIERRLDRMVQAEVRRSQHYGMYR